MPENTEKLTVPQGEFQLARYPLGTRQTLRAWDAADEYLLHQLATEEIADAPLLILNDGFGALSLALSDYRPVMISDSYLAHQGTRANLERNGTPVDRVRLLNSLQSPDGRFGLVLIKIPRSLALLEDQLYRLRPHVHPDTRIIGAGMVRHIHTSTLKLFERVIGPTRTSLARKKARLIFCTPDMGLNPGNSPYPGAYILEGTDFRIINHAAVFSQASLDIGTRFLLQHIPASPDYRTIIDLGCGNGVAGLVAAGRNPQAELVFTDESFMAITSARTNFEAAFPQHGKADFRVTDCLDGIVENSADLVLNNPPFHQQAAVGDAAAWKMFSQSLRVLRPGGELWVIGNRHLGYHVKLKRLFGNCATVAGNRKFVILKAVRR